MSLPLPQTAAKWYTVDMQFGEYRVVRLLGKGGMSEVYEVEHVRLESRHALKLFTYGGDAAQVRDRFLAEGHLLARLSHPRIVRVADIGVDEASGRPYFVMDLVLDASGSVRSLADVSAGAADEDQVAMWYDDLREGLAYIHGKGVIHRDLKLQNVLVGPDGHAVLADFGISKIKDPQLGGKEGKVDPVQTLVRMKDGKTPVMGSLGYMAPELELGAEATPASDWYALGVIVFRLLTGVWCDSRTDVVSDLDSYDPVWSRIIPKLLHSNPDGRECLSWRELKEAANEEAAIESENALASAQDALADATGRLARARRLVKVLAWTAGAAVAAAAVGAFFAVRSEPPVFADVVRIPDDASDEESETMPSRDDFASARVDAWVLTEEVFERLRLGRLTVKEAADSLVRTAGEVASGDGKFPEYYQGDELGDADTLAWLLNSAATNLLRGVRSR